MIRSGCFWPGDHDMTSEHSEVKCRLPENHRQRPGIRTVKHVRAFPEGAFYFYNKGVVTDCRNPMAVIYY